MKKFISVAVFPAMLFSIALFSGCGSQSEEDMSVVVDNDFFKIEAPGGWDEGETLPGVISIFYSDAESEDARAKLMNFRDSFSVALDSKETLGEDYVAGIKDTLAQVLPNATYAEDKCFQVGERDACSFEIDLTQNEIHLKMVMVGVEGDGSDIWLITLTTTEANYDSTLPVFEKIFNTFELYSVE